MKVIAERNETGMDTICNQLLLGMNEINDFHEHDEWPKIGDDRL